jgi:hypothetical protein
VCTGKVEQSFAGETDYDKLSALCPNFTNILQAAFTCKDPKNAKKAT